MRCAGYGGAAGYCSDFTLLIGASINSFCSAMMDANHQSSLTPTRGGAKSMCFVGGHTVREAALGSCRMQETSTTMLHRWHGRDFRAQWRARVEVHVSVGNAPFHFRLAQVGLCRAMQ